MVITIHCSVWGNTVHRYVFETRTMKLCSPRKSRGASIDIHNHAKQNSIAKFLLGYGRFTPVKGTNNQNAPFNTCAHQDAENLTILCNLKFLNYVVLSIVAETGNA